MRAPLALLPTVWAVHNCVHMKRSWLGHASINPPVKQEGAVARASKRPLENSRSTASKSALSPPPSRHPRRVAAATQPASPAPGGTSTSAVAMSAHDSGVVSTASPDAPPYEPVSTTLPPALALLAPASHAPVRPPTAAVRARRQGSQGARHAAGATAIATPAADAAGARDAPLADVVAALGAQLGMGFAREIVEGGAWERDPAAALRRVGMVRDPV